MIEPKEELDYYSTFISFLLEHRLNKATNLKIGMRHYIENYIYADTRGI